ncbi:MAG: rhodanese-like domain-containing protein [Oxalobacter sp.]|nr:rhodanese-like domain-containing protein [Oxalobacter sp.]
MHRAIKARNAFMTALLAIAVVFTFSGNAFAQQKDIGRLTPTEALEYMKKTPNVFIVDVSTPEKFQAEHFTGSVNIPMNELLSRMNEIPKDRPVLIHCRLGRTCLKAYPLVKKMRPDIPEVSYIDGVPLFTEYNNWVKTQK